MWRPRSGNFWNLTGRVLPPKKCLTQGSNMLIYLLGTNHSAPLESRRPQTRQIPDCIPFSGLTWPFCTRDAVCQVESNPDGRSCLCSVRARCRLCHFLSLWFLPWKKRIQSWLLDSQTLGLYTVNSLVGDHPWCTTKWPPRRKINKTNPKLNWLPKLKKMLPF